VGCKLVSEVVQMGAGPRRSKNIERGDFPRYQSTVYHSALAKTHVDTIKDVH
jgi:hypothetical protein